MLILTHGDGDGVCAGALALMAHPRARVFFTHPSGLLEDLRGVDDDLVVCDIALDSRHADRIQERLGEVAAGGNSILYFDHHKVVPENFAADFPGEFVHARDKCATELVFEYFRGDGFDGFHAERLAIFGAIADYFDDTPLIQELLHKWEKRAIYLETGILVQGLYAYRWNYDAKRTLVRKLSWGSVPSAMKPLVKAALSQTKQEEVAMKRVAESFQRRGSIAWVVQPESSKSKAAHWVMGFADTPVGISVEFRKGFADLTIRGRGLVDLTEFVPGIAEAFDGNGGGHPNACGLRIPKNALEGVLGAIDREVGQRLA
ncbi:MAG: DHHA1 domain-containing protein [Promethearchaeota archaeon]